MDKVNNVATISKSISSISGTIYFFFSIVTLFFNLLGFHTHNDGIEFYGEGYSSSLGDEPLNKGPGFRQMIGTATRTDNEQHHAGETQGKFILGQEVEDDEAAEERLQHPEAQRYLV